MKSHKKERTGFFVFIVTLAISLIIVLFFFNLWNWYLAIKGYTTIEYWGGKNEKKAAQTHEGNKFYSSSYLENLEQIFGTQSFLKILKPTFRKMPHDGVSWSKRTEDIEQGNDEESLGVITQQI